MNEANNSLGDWLLNAIQDSEGAEYQNLRRALLGFLGVLDSLDRILDDSAAMSPEENTQLDLLRKQMLNVFQKNHVTFMNCSNQPFNPEYHQAIGITERADLADDTIAKVVLRGCLWQGHVLRHAQVIVVKNSTQHQ